MISSHLIKREAEEKGGGSCGGTLETSASLERERLIVFVREQSVTGTLFPHQHLQKGFEIKYRSDRIRHGRRNESGKESARESWVMGNKTNKMDEMILSSSMNILKPALIMCTQFNPGSMFKFNQYTPITREHFFPLMSP